jgi:hypothetical protein
MYGLMMSPACCGERQESWIVSVCRVDATFISDWLSAGMIVSADAIHIVATKAVPLAITATRPSRRRFDETTDCSAMAIG